MSKEEISEMSRVELVEMLKDLTNELVKLRIKKSVGQLGSPHVIRTVRRNIARVKTLLRLHDMTSDVEKEGRAA